MVSRYKFFGIACLLVLSGCVTPPQQHHFNNTIKINKSYDAVWANIVNYFASNNIALKNIAKDSGVIYAEHSFVDALTVDCGSDVPTPLDPAVMQLNVFVQHTNPVVVSVNTRTTESNVSAWDNSPYVMECTSRGTIEKVILDAAKK